MLWLRVRVIMKGFVPVHDRLQSDVSFVSDQDDLIRQIKSSLRLQLASFEQETETRPSGFLRLPPPVLIRIAVFLELRYRLSLAFASAKVRRTLFSAPQLWNRAYPTVQDGARRRSLCRSCWLAS